MVVRNLILSFFSKWKALDINNKYSWLILILKLPLLKLLAESEDSLAKRVLKGEIAEGFEQWNLKFKR